MKSLRLPFLLTILALFSGAATSQGGSLAQFRTVYGDIAVELLDQEKPKTVQNFIRYAQSGRYANQFSHRLIPGFILQGGGFAVTNGFPEPISTYPPITNEFGVGPQLSNLYGTLAMAKLPGDTNSATSQWFFNLADNVALDSPDADNAFVVFGRVIKGTNVLNVFNEFQYFNGAQQSNIVTDLTGVFGPGFSDCPLRYPVIISTNLVFLDITLLQVAIAPFAGGHEISWNSAASMTNIVEFTTNFPPNWNTLLRTNGNGLRMSTLDLSGDSGRYYRVRIAY